VVFQVHLRGLPAEVGLFPGLKTMIAGEKAMDLLFKSSTINGMVLENRFFRSGKF